MHKFLELLKYATTDFGTFIGCFVILSMILFFGVNGALRLFKSLVRLIMVSLRGWPPDHLDADGDFKEAYEPDLEE